MAKAKRASLDRAISSIWKLLEGHAMNCVCAECRERETLVDAVSKVGGVATKAAKTANGLLPPRQSKTARLQPIVTVDGVPAKAEFVRKGGK